MSPEDEAIRALRDTIVRINKRTEERGPVPELTVRVLVDIRKLLMGLAWLAVIAISGEEA